MDASYTFFRQLMVHWQQSVEGDDAGQNQDAPHSGPEQQVQQLIARFGQSWPSARLVFEED